MGYIIQTKCEGCDETQEIHLGYGMRDITAKQPRELGYCDICHKYVVVQDTQFCERKHPIRILYGEKEEQQKISSIPCPKCKMKMNIVHIGMWD